MKTRIEQWYATQGHLTPSIEGFGTLVGDLVRNFKHGRKKSVKAELDDKSLSNLAATYQNPAWLAKRRFVEGNVSFKGVLGVFAGDMEGNCDALCRELEVIQATNIRETKRLAGVAKNAIRFIESDSARDDVLAKSFISSLVLRVDAVFSGYRGKLGKVGTCQAPALGEAGIKMAVDYVLRLNKLRSTIDVLLLTPEWVKSFYLGEVGDLYPRFADGSDILVQFEKMESWSGMDLAAILDEYRYDIEAMFDQQLESTDLLVQDVIKTIIRWIDASVK